jgi:hypothetical protein
LWTRSVKSITRQSSLPGCRRSPRPNIWGGGGGGGGWQEQRRQQWSGVTYVCRWRRSGHQHLCLRLYLYLHLYLQAQHRRGAAYECQPPPPLCPPVCIAFGKAASSRLPPWAHLFVQPPPPPICSPNSPPHPTPSPVCTAPAPPPPPPPTPHLPPFLCVQPPLPPPPSPPGPPTCVYSPVDWVGRAMRMASTAGSSNPSVNTSQLISSGVTPRLGEGQGRVAALLSLGGFRCVWRRVGGWLLHTILHKTDAHLHPCTEADHPPPPAPAPTHTPPLT